MKMVGARSLLARLWFAASMLLAFSVSADNVEIDVVGLFTDAALLEINGRQQLLRKGERSSEGILLISAHSREAVVEISGKQMTLNLSSRIGTQFEPQRGTSVSIALNGAGQYRTTGSVNGQPVAFLVDTGANILAMNTHHAVQIGINYEKNGRESQVLTAAGPVKSWEIQLDTVQIGDIQVRNVKAAVLEGDFPADVLLGMTFLRSVEMNESAGVMVLKSKL